MSENLEMEALVAALQQKLLEAEAKLEKVGSLKMDTEIAELQHKLTSVEKRALAAEKIIEIWRAAHGFANVSAEGWIFVERMDKAVEGYDAMMDGSGKE